VEKEIDLKKQSQFTPAQIDAKSYSKGFYDNTPACGVEENKANQSQTPVFGRKSEVLHREY